MTGTDTGIGKTLVSAALLVRYAAQVAPRYWKPIQTGIEVDDDTRTVASLAPGVRPLTSGVRLPGAWSPHLSARRAGQPIDLESLLAIARAQSAADRFIVEGAGGVLVPISNTVLMVDLIRALDLPALIVARSTLGTINHTLLTIEALRARRITVAGVVMNGPPDEENRQAIEAIGGTEVLAQLAPLDHVDAAAVARVAPAIDRDGRLWERAFA